MSKIKGMDALQANLNELIKSTDKNMKSALVAGGKLVESDAKKSIASKSGSKIVKRSRNGGGSYDHTVSSEGSAPNTDTGALIKSINTEIEPDNVFVGTSIKYGKFLEFGTNDTGERPWLIPALNGRKDDILKLQIGAMNKSIKEAGKIV